MKKIGCFLLIAMLSCCGSKEDENKDFEWNNEISTKYNKLNSQEEEIDINLYLARKPTWNMVKTGSGLRYYIYETKDKSEKPQIGNTVDVQYKVELLDGEVVDETKEDEVQEFIVDRAQIETGIQEAVKLMKEGERAKLIIPSHLAHGLIGDLSKIPPLSILIVDLYLHHINK